LGRSATAKKREREKERKKEKKKVLNTKAGGM